jgi:hypothetical protein
VFRLGHIPEGGVSTTFSQGTSGLIPPLLAEIFLFGKSEKIKGKREEGRKNEGEDTMWMFDQVLLQNMDRNDPVLDFERRMNQR